MSNEAFVAIAIAVVISVLIGLFLGSCYSKYKTKKEQGGEVEITLAKVMSYLTQITNEIYSIYKSYSTQVINPLDYKSNEDYRKQIISTTIDHIINICADYGIEINFDKSLLESVACLIIEDILRRFELEEKQAKIENLSAKIVILEETGGATEKVANATEEPEADPVLSVTMGDFYN